ncbi:glycosyl hydrolase [Niabella yanshanensis]|uniref:Glycosyl hydrolase n=1 Tax=Niabella yanshanensis TaxID=577386 RepID=A0ABZ0W5G9_9BACT|nr:glycosyl hydrolase [Niabella yanshanensis]WQD37873.1 glycosyl hydrolase [Niabella yanshanensis]
MKKLLFSCLMILGISQLMAQAQWPAITQQAKPWTRWWWMGSAVDEKNISNLLKQYGQSGLGGVEIVPIYGAKGYENRYIKYLSPQWMQMLDHTVSQANALNMGVYISVGTGWPIGGSHVTQEDAASKALVQQYDLKANTTLQDLIVVNDPKQKEGAVLSVLMGYNNAGQATELTNKVDAAGKLNFKPNEDLKLLALFNGKTRQAVKRAAPGGEGFTIDHFSKSATVNYFKAFDAAFGNSSHGVKGFFNDSYEVYGANWTPEFFNEFSKRRGYDLKQYINALFSDAKDDRTARIKSDYRETMADLMRENFSTVYTKWTHQRKALSINQAHGSPGNLLDLYGAFDVPETETFGSSYFPVKGLRRDSADIRNVDPDPNMLKFASSAAHAYGKPLTSCETFTWLSEHFKTSWSQCKPEVDQVFLSGINHVFYHGTTYSPADAKWPGWLFYASVNFVPNNSLWPHLKGLNDYIARCQSVLQAGMPDNELAIYWPIYDIWHNAKGMDKPLSVHHVDDWLHPTAFYKNLVSLQNEGYALDFVSDKMLEQAKAGGTQFSISPKGGRHKVLLIPAADKMPVATFKNIVRLAHEGASVVIQQFPQDVPGYKDVELQRAELKRLVAELRLSASNKLQVASVGKGKIIVGDMHEALAYLKIARETIADEGLKFIRRKTTDARYYFIVNNTAGDFDKTIFLENTAATVVIMDPVNGTVNKVVHQKNSTATGFRLQLKSGASIIVKLTDKKETAAAYRYSEPAGEAISLQNSKWTLSFKEGGPELPAARQMTGIKPWTDFTNDPRTQAFSGTGVYTTSFVLKNKAADYLLQLDELYESARIIVNGKDAGLIWSLPFEKRIGQYLKPGNNTISVEVCNLMANRIRDMDQKGEVWRNYHEINFVNINYKDFNAGKWNVQPSGLGGTVQLVPLK